MQKICLTLSLLSVSTWALAGEFENNYGTGVVHITTDSVNTVEFYATPGGEVSHHLYLTHNAWSVDRTMTTFDGLIDSVPLWFDAEFFLADGMFGRIDIKAVDSVGDYYRTLLHDDAGRDVFVKKSKHIQFLNWFSFYTSLTGVSLLSNNIILFSAPNESAEQINYSPMILEGSSSNLRPLQIQGDWMEVELQFQDIGPSFLQRFATGWIKWRDDQQLLIKKNLFGC